MKVASGLKTAAISGNIFLSGVVYAQRDVLDYVNPLIGTTNGGMYTIHTAYYGYSDSYAGHVFPGASLPFGQF